MIRIAIGLFLFLLLTPFANGSQKDEVASAAGQLEQTIKDIPGVKITTIGNVILLEGTVTKAEQMARLSRIVEGLKDLSGPSGRIIVRNTSVISQEARENLAHEVALQIDHPGVTVRFVKETMFIEGAVETDFQADRAVEIARSHLRSGNPDFRRPAGLKDGGKATMYSSHPAWGNVTIVDMLRVTGRKVAKAGK